MKRIGSPKSAIRKSPPASAPPPPIKPPAFTHGAAVGYLADRLTRLGVEAELAKAGAEAGAEVIIGDVAFDWEPGMLSGSEHRIGPRGTDARLDGR